MPEEYYVSHMSQGIQCTQYTRAHTCLDLDIGILDLIANAQMQPER